MKVVPKKWELGAFVGFLSGIVLGFLVASFTNDKNLAVMSGVAGAFAGAITGIYKRRIAIAIVGFLLSSFLFMINIKPMGL